MFHHSEKLSQKTTSTTLDSTDVEQALLGWLISNTDRFYQLPADLSAEQFGNGLHQHIFDTIANEVTAGNTTNAILLNRRLAALEGYQDGYVGKLMMGAVHVTNPKDYAEMVIDLHKRRKLLQACQAAMEAAIDIDGMDTSEIGASLAVQLDNLNGKMRYLVSTEREVTARIADRLTAGKTRCTPTGLSQLDTAMGGGMFAGKMYGIVGRKKMGKTMMSGTISTNLQQSGEKHIYFALEMGSDEIQQRNLGNVFAFKESYFRTHNPHPSIHNKIANYAVTAPNNRYYVDSPGITFAELKHILPLYIRKFGVQGFILDCWQLVGGKAKGKSTAEHQDEVAQWLAETCKKYQVWGLVTAQENQDGNTRGGEGLRLACDQAYRINKKEVESPKAWMELMDTRYTGWNNVGDENSPAFGMSDNGTHYYEL